MTKEEKKTYDRAYRLSHRDEIKAKNIAYCLINAERLKAARRIYRLANRKKTAEYNKNWRLANPEKVKATKEKYHITHSLEEKSYRIANKDKAMARKKTYNNNHPEKKKMLHKAYCLANPEKFAAYSRRRRAIKRGVQHQPYTDISIFEYDSWVCQICGKKINKKLKWPHPRSKSIDHIIALSNGGNDSPENVQSAHLRCNLGKYAKNGGQLRLKFA
jgi:hypothetical protein